MANRLALFGILIALYVPTFLLLSESIWPQEQYSHGELIPLMFAFMLYVKRDHWIRTESAGPAALRGFYWIALGALILVIGRRSSVLLLEVLSLLPMLYGAALIGLGLKAAQALRFSVLFLLFLVPLPGILMYQLTSELKLLNASLVVDLLYLFDLPVAHDGVVITIGRYQLFLADACAGINSLFALTALGLMILHLSPGLNRMRRFAIATMIVPLALLANFVRVLVALVLTYNFSDVLADQLHVYIGYLTFILALLTLLFAERKLLANRGIYG